MLPLNHIKEEISRAYIKIVCNHAGYVLSFPERDYGLDVNVREVNVKPHLDSLKYRFTGTNLDIQLKSTASCSEDETSIIYDLSGQAYNDLVESQGSGTRRILVLLVLPEGDLQYIAQDTECLKLMKCAYWFSLEGLTPVPDITSTKRIRVPKQNVFSSTALDGMMRAIKNKESFSNA